MHDDLGQSRVLSSQACFLVVPKTSPTAGLGADGGGCNQWQCILKRHLSLPRRFAQPRSSAAASESARMGGCQALLRVGALVQAEIAFSRFTCIPAAIHRLQSESAEAHFWRSNAVRVAPPCALHNARFLDALTRRDLRAVISGAHQEGHGLAIR